MSDETSEEEYFHNHYHLFHLTLKRLEKDYLTQCTLGDHFNVAGELHDELLLFAAFVLHYPANGLTDEQKTQITNLVANVKAIPKSVMSGDRTVEGSRRDMSQPCWIPLREQAAKLLKLLEPATQRNIEYFRTQE